MPTIIEMLDADPETWRSMKDAPRCGKDIEGLYGHDVDIIYWSDWRSTGDDYGMYGPGWVSLEVNLPVDEPDAWRHLT